MRVGLVADVPEDLVARGVEQRVQRDRDLAGAEVGAEVTADLADGVDDVLAHLLRDLLQLLVVEAVQVLRAGRSCRGGLACGASVAPRRDEVGDLLELVGVAGGRARRAPRAPVRGIRLAKLRAPSSPNSVT